MSGADETEFSSTVVVASGESVPESASPESPISPPEEPPVVQTRGFDPLSPPWGLTTKAIIASAVIILGALAIWRFQFLISPLVLAAVVAYLLNPLVSWLTHKTTMSRTQSVLLVYLVLLLIVGGGSFFLGLIVAQQSVRLWESLPEFLPNLVDTIQDRLVSWSNINFTFGPYTFESGSILDSINLDLERLSAEITTTVQSILGRSGVWLAGFATATLSTLSDIFFVLIVSIYLAMDGPRIGRGISEIAHQPGYRRDAERLIQDSVRIWDAYLRGQVILGIVIFAIVSLCLSALGVNNAIELGILSGVLEFLPIIGPFIGTAAAVIVALVQDSNMWGLSPWVFALIVLGVMVLIQQVENAILVPRIVGDALDLHALVVLIGVLMGTSLAGLLGAVLAAPVIATLKLFGMYTWRKMLDLPPFHDDPMNAQAQSSGDGGVMAWLTKWFSSQTSKTS